MKQANRAKLADMLTRQAVPPAKGYRIIWDTVIPGFGLRVTAAGARSFVFNYRARGIERRMTIGQYTGKDGAWTVAAARAEAKKLKRRIDKGEDPMAEIHKERVAPTVAALCRRYREEHLPKKRPSSQAEDRRQIDLYVLPSLGKMKVADVEHADIEKLHLSLKDRPYRAPLS